MIEGKNINLRLMRESDLEDFVAQTQRVNDRGGYHPLTIRSMAEQKKLMEENGFWSEELYLMLVSDKNDKMLGYIAAFKSHRYFTGLEIGYIVFKPENRGKGIMTEALKLFTAYFFDLHPYPMLYLITVPENDACRRIAEKAGFKLEGVLRNSGYNLGEYCNLAIYSLLKEECKHLHEVLADINR